MATPITTRAQLLDHLQLALELEHATIPPYLCALYSIRDGTNTQAATVIRSVVMEEMLHMTLVANLINAIDGKPRLNETKFVPNYPTFLPEIVHKFIVDLQPFSPGAIQTFLNIEQPPGPRPPAAEPADDNRYGSIGEFYTAVRAGVKVLSEEGKPSIFTGDVQRQVRPEHWYYGGGGHALIVTDAESACKAIEEVVEQGEGVTGALFDDDRMDGSDKYELAHYYRFKEIELGRCYLQSDTPESGPRGPELLVDWESSYPMTINPKVRDFAGEPEIQALMQQFNRLYTKLLDVLHDAFNGQPHLLRDAVPLMYDLKYRAQALMRIPWRDGRTAGPSFELTR